MGAIGARAQSQIVRCDLSLVEEKRSPSKITRALDESLLSFVLQIVLIFNVQYTGVYTRVFKKSKISTPIPNAKGSKTVCLGGEK